MSFVDLEELTALRREVEAIARGAGQISTEGVAAPSATAYSFGIASAAEEKILAIGESIRQTLAKLAPVAQFQTTVDGCSAKTVIGYRGMAATVWTPDATAELVEAHAEALERAFAFRSAVVAVVAAAGNAAVAIAIAAGNPLTAWRAVKPAEALKTAVDRLAAAVAAQSSSPVTWL